MKENKKQWKTFKSIKINNECYKKLKNISFQLNKPMVKILQEMFDYNSITIEEIRLFNEYSNKNKND